jgi:hypothetical protein
MQRTSVTLYSKLFEKFFRWLGWKPPSEGSEWNDTPGNRSVYPDEVIRTIYKAGWVAVIFAAGSIIFVSAIAYLKAAGKQVSPFNVIAALLAAIWIVLAPLWFAV